MLFTVKYRLNLDFPSNDGAFSKVHYVSTLYYRMIKLEKCILNAKRKKGFEEFGYIVSVRVESDCEKKEIIIVLGIEYENENVVKKVFSSNEFLEKLSNYIRLGLTISNYSWELNALMIEHGNKNAWTLEDEENEKRELLSECLLEEKNVRKNFLSYNVYYKMIFNKEIFERVKEIAGVLEKRLVESEYCMLNKVAPLKGRFKEAICRMTIMAKNAEDANIEAYILKHFLAYHVNQLLNNEIDDVRVLTPEIIKEDTDEELLDDDEENILRKIFHHSIKNSLLDDNKALVLPTYSMPLSKYQLEDSALFGLHIEYGVSPFNAVEYLIERFGEPDKHPIDITRDSVFNRERRFRIREREINETIEKNKKKKKSVFINFIPS